MAVGPELTILDAFSGLGGFSYAAERLLKGFKTTQFVEIDPFCRAVLRLHWPLVPIHNDIKTFHAARDTFDVITAGFPCQDISSAGKQRGLQTERSGLFYEVIRLAREIRPRFVLFENVGNLLSHQNGETFQEVLFQIAKAGFDAEWAVIPASDMGACHQRKRIWIIAYKPGRQKLLTDSNSLHSKRRGKAGHLASEARKGESRCQKQQWHGDATNDCSANVANTCQFDMEGCWPERQQILRSSRESEGALWSDQGIERLHPDWRSYVSEPVLRRGDDGLSGRVDRLRSLGNSIVPQAAAIPLRRILELNNLENPK